jgi:hypothetical protein
MWGGAHRHMCNCRRPFGICSDTDSAYPISLALVIRPGTALRAKQSFTIRRIADLFVGSCRVEGEIRYAPEYSQGCYPESTYDVIELIGTQH